MPAYVPNRAGHPVEFTRFTHVIKGHPTSLDAIHIANKVAKNSSSLKEPTVLPGSALSVGRNGGNSMSPFFRGTLAAVASDFNSIHIGNRF